MRIQLYDRITGEPAGEWEIPDEVMKAAVLVEHWIRTQEKPEEVRLSGLRLAESN